MKQRHIIIGALIALFGMYCIFSFNESLTPYVSIAQAKTAANNVQVKGVLAKNHRPPYSENGKFYFGLEDENGDVVTVAYKGPKPEGFDDAVHIVAIGKYKDNEIQTDKLLIKCPSKYEAKGGQK